MEVLKTWKKNQTALYINTLQNNAHPQDWARIGKSTIFDLKFNANTESYDFIEDESPTEIIKNYAPAIGEELRCVRGDKAFDAMFEYTYNLPRGAEAVRDALLVFPAIQAAGVGGEEPGYFAWLASASLVASSFNTVDEKLLFDLKFAGDITRGYVQAVDGAPLFTPFDDQAVWQATADSV